MPAAFAISIVGVPCRPRAAKTCPAASRIDSPPSSAGDRVLLVAGGGAAMTECEYALTHNSCQVRSGPALDDRDDDRDDEDEAPRLDRQRDAAARADGRVRDRA